MILYRRKDRPYWYVDLRRYGLGQVSTGQIDPKAAERDAIRFLAERHISPSHQAGTLADLIERYMAWSRVHHTERVYVRNRHLLSQFVARCGPETPLHKVTAGMIEEFKASRQVKPATINRDLTTIKHLFNRAVDWGMLKESPARTIRRLRAPKPLPRFYSPAEVKTILEASGEPWKSIWLIALNTGMRLGEICGLTWKDVQAERIRIRAPKEGREKIIPISAQLAGVLSSMPRETDRVVPCTSSAVSIRFRRLVRRLGIGGSFHKLRHSVATHLLNQGVPLHVVSKLLGHASIATTAIYLHANESDLKKAVEKADFVTGLLPDGAQPIQNT